MVLSIYCFLLTILQLVLLISYFIKRTNNIIEKFTWLSVFNVLIDALFMAYTLVSDYYTSWDGVAIFCLIIIFMIIHAIIYIIGKIANIIQKNTMKLIESSKKSNNIIKDSVDTTKEPVNTDKKVKRFTLFPKITASTKKFLIILLITAVVFFAANIISNQLAIHKQENKNKEYGKKAVQLLNKRYGDCGFKVEEATYIPSDTTFIGETTEASYNITISSNLFDKTFTVEILENEPNKLYEEDFLDLYYEHKYKVTNIYTYIEDMAEKSFKEKVSNKFNVNITLNAYLPVFFDDNYGKVPTPEDLLKYVSISKINISILDTVTSKEQLNKNILSLTKYILNDVNKVPLSDLQDGIIYSFTYKYKDTNKKGSNNQLDVYNGSVTIENKSHIKIEAFDEVTTLPIEKIITDAN